MNDTALATQVRPGGLSLPTVAEMAQKLRYMIQNGSKLADQEVMALAQYSVANDLNPFAAECYYMPGKGPCPGIAGWRKKAQEQLDWEAAQAHEQGAHFWVEYVQATQEEAKFDPSKGDIAWKVILRDWLTMKRWRSAYFATVRDLRECGCENPLEEAKKYVGPEPVWIGVGVVFGTENFGGDKMDRNERAQKRAEKLALRKRFPLVNLPEPEGADVVDVQLVDAPTRTSNKTEADLMSEITGEKPAAPAPEPVTEGEVISEPEQPKAPEPEGPKPLNYAGPTAVIGKHKYPVAWCQLLAGYKRVNPFEVDGILQKLALPGGTMPEDVVAEIDLYLEEGAHGQPSLL